jgi:hypothetical protein
MGLSPITIIALFYLVLLALIAAAAFAQRKKARITAALACLGWSALMLTVADWAQGLNHNIWYSDAANRMIESYIAGIERGSLNAVVTEMKRMTNELQVTYEHRGNFRQLAERAARDLSATNSEPSGSANVSQPIRSETNAASPTAGSHR